jgi:hypothetical protein
MKKLRGHMVHGNESYYETGYILRRSRYGVRSSAILASFEDVNRVVVLPTFKTQMEMLITKLFPSDRPGEWLKRPTQAGALPKGRWRIDEEWQWAEKWSIVYGGTWTGL